ncbi:MAG: nodulation protein NfeD [Acidobacteria bacterium]|nr:nodulation protein NfeD [Acidobacteriota bacterium]MCI0626122.1 nodulation protein NfeD [Acidobacteriota bacterium]MCI0723556.1 nodulation protein NfeD [Acidobacteriota bacterium]
MSKIWLSLLMLLASRSPALAGILKLDLDDVIHPITAEYVVQGITQAETEQATAVILRLSTPGGLEPSTREIIEKILSTKVPVIVFVGPSGMRAASAGFFILLAADVAVMAPGTNTGAAHPVSIGGGKSDEVMAKKIENDAAAYLRSFTAKRGRNAAVAEKGVTESKSFTEAEALKEGLIDGVAKDINEIVEKFDGKKIQRFDGSSLVLKLKGESLRAFEMTLRQRVLAKALNPNIALMLGLIGLMGLYIEFTHPGLIVPGVAGGLCLFLALVALNILPVNVLGVALILAALVLFVVEAKVTSYGLLAALGIAAMVFGSLILIDSPIPELRVKLSTAVGMALPFAAITVFLMRLVILAHRHKSVTGEEGMVNEVGVALTDIDGDGKIRVHGEIWQASSETSIAAGEQVKVLAVDGMKVRVGRL